MWPGLGDIVSLVLVVSLDFLERVNLINKRLEQERGEKFTFSSQYSSIGLYCAAKSSTTTLVRLRRQCLSVLLRFDCGTVLLSLLLGSIAVPLNHWYVLTTASFVLAPVWFWNYLATLSLGYLCWLVGMLRSTHTGTIAQATAVFCFIGTCSGCFVL